MPPAPKRSCSTYAPAAVRRSARRSGTAGRVRLLCARARHGRAARRRHLASGRDAASGRRRRPGFPASPRGGSATAMPPRRVSAGRPARAAARASRRRAITGRRAPNRPRAGPRSVEPLAEAAARAESPESFYGLLARETLGMATKLPARPVHRLRSAGRPDIPTSSARPSWRGSASPRWPRRCFATRPRSALPPSTTR